MQAAAPFPTGVLGRIPPIDTFDSVNAQVL
jgi:hypothetical protein